MNLVHRRSKKSPSRIAGFFCKFGELPAPPDHFVRKREWGMHKFLRVFPSMITRGVYRI